MCIDRGNGRSECTAVGTGKCASIEGMGVASVQL